MHAYGDFVSPRLGCEPLPCRKSVAGFACARLSGVAPALLQSIRISIGLPGLSCIVAHGACVYMRVRGVSLACASGTLPPKIRRVKRLVSVLFFESLTRSLTCRRLDKQLLDRRYCQLSAAEWTAAHKGDAILHIKNRAWDAGRCPRICYGPRCCMAAWIENSLWDTRYMRDSVDYTEPDARAVGAA